MLGAGSFVSALLRVVGTVAVLAAVYFFIVKPVLHTTEKVSHDVNRSVNRSFRQSQRQQARVQRQVRRSTRQATRQASRAMRQAGIQASQATNQVQKAVHGQTSVSGLPAHAQKVIKCLQNANGDVTKLQKCH
jgi:uncharacterized membrane protein